ncbi:MAG: hypothetical protein HUJ99_07265, partial [Bacteroidaceae bacterium]|nr:hypothetical protein [Bacteroidaceae bacterium]
KPVELVKKGVRVSFKVPEKVRPSDKLYVLRDSEELQQERIRKQPFVIVRQ